VDGAGGGGELKVVRCEFERTLISRLLISEETRACKMNGVERAEIHRKRFRRAADHSPIETDDIETTKDVGDLSTLRRHLERPCTGKPQTVENSTALDKSQLACESGFDLSPLTERFVLAKNNSQDDRGVDVGDQRYFFPERS
jgi:hypothetical protein